MEELSKNFFSCAYLETIDGKVNPAPIVNTSRKINMPHDVNGNFVTGFPLKTCAKYLSFMTPRVIFTADVNPNLYSAGLTDANSQSEVTVFAVTYVPPYTRHTNTKVGLVKNARGVLRE